MVQRTIDGLVVRSARERVGGGQSGCSNGRRQGETLTLRTARPATTKTTRTAKATRQAARDEFLQPVKSFDLSVETTEKATGRKVKDEADWSDLLDQLEQHSGPDDLGLERQEEWLDEDDLKGETAGEQKAGRGSRKTARAERRQSGRKRGKSAGTDGDAKAPRKKHKGLRIALIVILVLLLGGGAVLLIWGDAIISRLTNGNSGIWDTIAAVVSEEVPFETDENGRTNVLVFGTEGYDMNGTVAGGQHDGAQLTDSIMVVSFDQETKDVAMVSLPRDLKVGACMVGKINEVFSCNNADGANEEAGALALAETVEEVLGLQIQYWAHVNWASLIEIVDTLGGITVTFDEDIYDPGYTGVSATAGVPITLNGEQALAFARARHGTQGGDFTRGNTQQKIVMAIVQKVIDNGVGVTEAFSLLNILGDNLRTNFSAENIKSGVKLASGFEVGAMRQIKLVDYENQVYYLTTPTINGISYVTPTAGDGNYSEIRELVAQQTSSDPVVREGAVLAVYNGTEGYGVAGAEREVLEAAGFTVETVGDTAVGNCTERYCVYVLNDEKAGTRAALEERYGVTARPGAELPADIWAGTADFVVIVGPEPVTEEGAE